MTQYLTLLIGIGFALLLNPAFASTSTETTDKQTFTVRELANGLEHPWGMSFLPNGDILVTEREGRLRLLTTEGLQPAAISGVPSVFARGQGGLLDVAIDPAFADNQFVYLCYSAAGKEGKGTELARGELRGRPGQQRLDKLTTLFHVQPKTSRGANHFGCRIAFDKDGFLYLSLGDRFHHMKEAQNPDNHLGTIVRLHADGTIPADNPFPKGDAPEMYSYGHRNIQGLAVRPSDGSVWAHEHGPRGGDEVNRIKAGINYGWPAITYGINYSGSKISDKTSAPDMAQPIVYWDPSIAPSGMAFYNGNAFPDWQGNLFVGSLKFTHLRRLTMDGDHIVKQEELLRDRGERIRDVRVGADGLIYLLTDSGNGKVLRLEPGE